MKPIVFGHLFAIFISLNSFANSDAYITTEDSGQNKYERISNIEKYLTKMGETLPGLKETDKKLLLELEKINKLLVSLKEDEVKKIGQVTGDVEKIKKEEIEKIKAELTALKTTKNVEMEKELKEMKESLTQMQAVIKSLQGTVGTISGIGQRAALTSPTTSEGKIKKDIFTPAEKNADQSPPEVSLPEDEPAPSENLPW